MYFNCQRDLIWFYFGFCHWQNITLSYDVSWREEVGGGYFENHMGRCFLLFYCLFLWHFHVITSLILRVTTVMSLMTFTINLHPFKKQLFITFVNPWFWVFWMERFSLFHYLPTILKQNNLNRNCKKDNRYWQRTHNVCSSLWFLQLHAQSSTPKSPQPVTVTAASVC